MKSVLQLKRATVAAELFLGGKNLGTKLYAEKHQGIEIEYCRKDRQLTVKWNGEEAIVPEAGISNLVYGPVEVVARQPGGAGAVNAQVSTPTQHVFAGAGHGKTGQQEN